MAPIGTPACVNHRENGQKQPQPPSNTPPARPPPHAASPRARPPPQAHRAGRQRRALRGWGANRQVSGGSGRRGETPGRRRGRRCGGVRRQADGGSGASAAGGAWFATGRRGVRAPYCGRGGDGARRPAAERAGPIHSENRQQGRRAVRQAIGAGVCNSETVRREATGPERPSTAPPVSRAPEHTSLAVQPQKERAPPAGRNARHPTR